MTKSTGRKTATAKPSAEPKKAALDQIDPEIAAKVDSLRSHVRESFGKVVMSMMMLPRYRHQTLNDLQHLVLEPLIRDRIAIAQRAEGSTPATQDIAGVAIWASLSDEAEARLREQINAGAWPLRLKADDWNSGQNNWLIDVIATDQKATASVIANFRQVLKDGSLKLHPLITRLVDPETLKSMGATRASEAQKPPVEPAPEGATIN
ncbi:MAG: toxin-activating lysine-acyltransferase [Pseudomonadota bacterium]